MVDRYLQTKGKALGTLEWEADAIVNRWTTDSLLILDPELTDKLPTNYRCYSNQLSVDLLPDTQPSVKGHSADASTDFWLTLIRCSTDIVTDMLTDELFEIWLDTPYKKHDPNTSPSTRA